MSRYISTIHRVRIDFTITNRSDAVEKAFWDGVFNGELAKKSLHIESCEMNMYIQADFDSVKLAETFEAFLIAYLEDNECDILE